MESRHTRPNVRVPKGACDCHMHVFGPLDRYPPAVRRSYTPREASLADYRKMASILGLERIVFVQASAYGADNSCMLDALATAGKNSRGVAVIDETTSDAELLALERAGVRGVRLNAETFGLRSPDEIARQLRRLAQRIGPLGLHLQLFTTLAVIAELASEIGSLGVPVVIDHMGMAKAALGPKQDGFEKLVRLVAEGCWVKLSGAYRVSSAEPDHADAAPIARALIAASPERVLWGTDWPHTGKHGNASIGGAPVIEYRPLDDGRLLSLLGDWTDDDATLKRILVDNPARLYGFGA